MQSHTQAVSKAPTLSNLTTHPVFAVLGVLLGALTSVFTGRLLSIGLTDVQGAIGASADYMSWVSTAYNAANMFVGPITVFMGALLGARRVLLWASVVFILSEFLTPFCGQNQMAFIALQIIAGLAAGTYYPLTFTIIVRNFALKYIYLGIAVYALDILASTHIAHLVESFYILHLSWEWIFWNALLVAPLMILSVYFGIPRQPLPEPKPGMSFWGFLYASLGFTSLYIGLDQGERLDWLNSPLIAALFAVGIFFLTVAVVSRIRKPNKLLNLNFLRSRNFLVLGLVLIFFRFLLLEPTLLIPSYLQGLHAYKAEQIASVLAWIALPVLLFAPISGLLLYKMDSRLVCAIGFAIVGFTSFFNSKLVPGWTGENFVVPQIATAAGLCLALAGLIATILRSALAVGALKNPLNILTLSCWMQTCRLFGAELGKAGMTHFLKVRGDFHCATMAGHVDSGWLTEERIKALAETQMSGSANPNESVAKAAAHLGVLLKHQVTLLTLADGFLCIVFVAAFALVALGALSYSPPLTAPNEKD